MPGIDEYCYRSRPKTWATMDRNHRKAFHRENLSRISRGLSALPKP